LEAHETVDDLSDDNYSILHIGSKTEGTTPMTIDREAIIEALAELVRIPSINPSLVPGADGERAIAESIAARLRRTPGIAVELQDAGDGRPNVIASTGDGAGRTLMINGHIDTVGVAGMEEPFSGRVDGNRLYGRGSNDMKGAMAGALVLLEEIARRGDFPGRLVVTFVADEEHSSIGTEAICREIDRWKPDAALVVEPTGLEITTAHKGFVWATIRTQGFAAHGSQWQVGIDAIAHMGRVIVALEEFSRELVGRTAHPVVGPPSMHLSLIRGGQELSSYPEECVLEIERRTIPGETVAAVEAELRAILDRLSAEDDQFKATLELGLTRDAYEIDRASELVTTLAGFIRATTGRDPVYSGAAGWMDSALLGAAGVPTAIFGPDGAGEHGLVEWADIDSIVTFTTILGDIAYGYCG
jgi:acetylornithine deacetylase